MRGQLAFMRERGFRVTLVASPGEMLQETAAREGVEAVGLPMRREPAPLRDAAALVRLLRLVRGLKPDITNVSTAKAGLLGGISAWTAGVPIRLFTLRGIRAETFTGFGRSALLGLESASCRLAHRVFCISHSLRRKAIELGLVRARKSVVLGSGTSNGIDCHRFRRTPEVLDRARRLRARLGLPEGAPVVGFVGRLVIDKGVVELLSAFRELRRRFPDLRLLLVGPAESYNALPEASRREIERGEPIAATGFLEDTAPAYALMDVLAFPTYREGFGNVALEAAAMELPAVASRVTGCVDGVVDGVTGTLVPPRDAEALAGAIARYVENPDLGRRHGRAGRERVVRDFRPERIWEALYEEYVRLLKRRGLPLPGGDRAS
jgi:glycosyltransferase involved in cell wall biosynthesis